MGSANPTQEVISAQEDKNNSQTSHWTLSEPRGELKYMLNSWGITILLSNWQQQDTLGTESRNSVHFSHNCLLWAGGTEMVASTQMPKSLKIYHPFSELSIPLNALNVQLYFRVLQYWFFWFLAAHCFFVAWIDFWNFLFWNVPWGDSHSAYIHVSGMPKL